MTILEFLSQLSPESRIKFSNLPDEIQIEISIAHSDVLHALETGTIYFRVNLSPIATAFYSQQISPYLHRYAEKKKTGLVLRINKDIVMHLGSKKLAAVLLGGGVATCILAPKTTPFVVAGFAALGLIYYYKSKRTDEESSPVFYGLPAY